jgi:hypothetical protein
VGDASGEAEIDDDALLEIVCDADALLEAALVLDGLVDRDAEGTGRGSTSVPVADGDSDGHTGTAHSQNAHCGNSFDGRALADTVDGALARGVAQLLGLALADAREEIDPSERVDETLRVITADPLLTEGVAVSVGSDDCLATRVVDPVRDADAGDVRERVPRAETLGLGDSDTSGDTDLDGCGEDDASAEMVCVPLSPAVGSSYVGSAVGVLDCELEPEIVSVGLADADCDGEASAVRVPPAAVAVFRLV